MLRTIFFNAFQRLIKIGVDFNFRLYSIDNFTRSTVIDTKLPFHLFHDHVNF